VDDVRRRGKRRRKKERNGGGVTSHVVSISIILSFINGRHQFLVFVAPQRRWRVCPRRRC
jgi:hypothetical protein